MNTREIITKENKNAKDKEKKETKPCICPEIDRAIRREAKMFSDPSWRRMTSDGFYNWG
jgi:hypothetical protein